MTKTNSVVDLFSAQAETPLARINQCLLTNEFIQVNDTIKDGEVVIGEMTPFEKAIYTVRQNISDEQKASIEKEIKPARSRIDLALIHQLDQRKQEHELIDDLFWASIRKRLGAVTIEGDGIGVREGYLIVQMPKNGKGLESLLDILMLTGIAGIHDCANCEGYDECDLPIRKARA